MTESRFGAADHQPPAGRPRPGIPIAPRASRAVDPPIVAFKARHAEHLRDRDFIDLNQAIPSYPPPPPVPEAMVAAAADPASHVYTPDPGLPECRAAIAGYLRHRHGAHLAPEEVLVTPGANAAFHFVANVLLDPGDRAALLSPYYFNHDMSVELLGGVVAEMPWRDRLPLDEVARAGIRVLVLVTPANPTGRTISPDEMAGAIAWARNRGITLVIDETYLEFPGRGARAFSALSLPGWSDCAIVVGSFSKSLALTGYRVGYICGAPAVLRQALKVQDTTVICAPRLGQIAATAALGWDGLNAWLAARRAEIEERVEAFTSTLAATPGPFRVEHAGAFFAWVRHPAVDPHTLRSRLQAFGHYGEPAPDGDLVADLLVHQARLLTLPGGSSGMLGENRLRVAVGNATPDRLTEAAARLQALELP